MSVSVKINMREIEKKVTEATVKKLQEKYGKVASRMRCPTHHKQATVKVEGQDVKRLSVRISGCCDEFRQLVREAIAKAK
jgi:hypothetical protein